MWMWMWMGQVHVACKLFHYLSLSAVCGPQLMCWLSENFLTQKKRNEKNLWHGARLKSSASCFILQLDPIESTIIVESCRTALP